MADQPEVATAGRGAAVPTPRGPAPRHVGRRPPHRTVRLVVLAVVLACLVGAVRTYVVGPVRISSQSMEPTLRAGDVVLVDRRGLELDDVARGDLVTFRSPETGAELLKRVVALPGETVATVDAILHVDGRPVTEPYVDFSDWEGIFNAQVVVPAGAVFVLGDNRGSSVDSRDFGPVPATALDGRVLVRLWPVVRLGGEQAEPPRD